MRCFKYLLVTDGSGIYVLRNIVDNSIYVGHASNLRRRRNAHRTNLMNGKHSNKHLQNACDLYGIDNFKFYVIEYCESDKIILAQVEQYWVDLLCPEYNIRAVVESNLGLKKSAEDIEKTATKLRGIPRSELIKAKISATLMGQKRPPEVVAKIAAKIRGQRRNGRRVLQFDFNGKLLNEFSSLQFASDAVGIKKLNMRYKSCGGYVWKYKDLDNASAK